MIPLFYIVGCLQQEYQIDKNALKKDFVNANLLINQAKKIVSKTDLEIKKINDIILPRFRSAVITSDNNDDIVKRLLNFMFTRDA